MTAVQERLGGSTRVPHGDTINTLLTLETDEFANVLRAGHSGWLCCSSGGTVEITMKPAGECKKAYNTVLTQRH
jgi:hypothetical protein